MNYKYIILFFFVLSCAEINNENITNNAQQVSGEKIEITTKPKISHSYFTGLLDSIENNSLSENWGDHERKIPYLLYYAVDSNLVEPYLDISIDYEFKKLKEACNGSAHVNWVFIRNSEVAEGSYFHVCKYGEYEKRSLNGLIQYHFSNISALKEISIKENQKKCVQHDAGFLEYDDYLVSCFEDGTILNHGVKSRYKMLQDSLLEVGAISQNEITEISSEIDLVKKYYDFPLAYPPIFKSIMSGEMIMHPFVHPSLFVPFIHIKTHGHTDYAITGLFEDQIKNKANFQNKELQSKTTDELNLTVAIAGQKKIIDSAVSEFYKNVNAKYINNPLAKPVVSIMALPGISDIKSSFIATYRRFYDTIQNISTLKMGM